MLPTISVLDSTNVRPGNSVVSTMKARFSAFLYVLVSISVISPARSNEGNIVANGKSNRKVHSTLADGSPCYLSDDQSGKGPICADQPGTTTAFFQSCTSLEYLCCSPDAKVPSPVGSGAKAIPYFPSTSPKCFATKADGSACYWALAATPESCAELGLAEIDRRSCSGRMEYLCCPRDK